jgi:hypothetical protein
MNDTPFQKAVTAWMADEAYRRLRVEAEAQAKEAGTSTLRLVEPRASENF